MSDRLYDAIEHAARLARLERREQHARDLEAEVEAYLDAHPAATANQIVFALSGRRNVILALVRAAKARRAGTSGPVPPDRRPG